MGRLKGRDVAGNVHALPDYLLNFQEYLASAAILILATCHDALRRDTAPDALRRGFGNAERLNLAPTQSIGARLVYQNENCCPRTMYERSVSELKDLSLLGLLQNGIQRIMLSSTG